MKRVILFLLSLGAVSVQAQLFWEEQNNTPGEQAIFFDFVTEDHAFATFQLTGTQEKIIRQTVDNGLSWTQVPHAIDSAQFMAFEAVNDSTIYACYRKFGSPNINVSKVFRSSDGGNSWTDLTPDTTETGYGWTSIEFTSDSVGFWVIAEKMYRTVDSGQSWSTIKLPVGHNAISMDFLNDSTGVIGTWDGTFGYHGGLLLTTDGGQTWADTAFLSENYTLMASVRMDEGGVAYGSTAGYNPYYNHLLVRSDDMGGSWNLLPIPRSLPEFKLVSFDIQDGEGYLIEESEGNSYFYSTENAGVSWTSTQTISGTGMWHMRLENTKGFLGGPINRVFYLDRTTNISNSFSEGTMLLAPNPASNSIRVISETIKSGLVRLYTLDGQLIQEKDFTSEMIIPIQDLPSGLYVIELHYLRNHERTLFIKN